MKTKRQQKAKAEGKDLKAVLVFALAFCLSLLQKTGAQSFLPSPNTQFSLYAH
jgi:hypothetical protein